MKKNTLQKDVRNAVEVAVKAQPGWEKKSAFNRAQILFYIGNFLLFYILYICNFSNIKKINPSMDFENWSFMKHKYESGAPRRI